MAKTRNVRLLKAVITLFGGLIFCVSCGRDISQKRLSDIESVLDSRADSPFLYTISEAGSGLILFIGQFSGKEGTQE